MILTYSNERFPALIEAGIKIHTIRADKHERWKPGMKIHHWMHNPRNVSKNPYQFSKNENNILISRQRIFILPKQKSILLGAAWEYDKEMGEVPVKESLNEKRQFLTNSQIDELAYNDGLENFRVFFTWFTEEFEGWILHWTKKVY